MMFVRTFKRLRIDVIERIDAGELDRGGDGERKWRASVRN